MVFFSRLNSYNAEYLLEINYNIYVIQFLIDIIERIAFNYIYVIEQKTIFYRNSGT